MSGFFVSVPVSFLQGTQYVILPQNVGDINSGGIRLLNGQDGNSFVLTIPDAATQTQSTVLTGATLNDSLPLALPQVVQTDANLPRIVSEDAAGLSLAQFMLPDALGATPALHVQPPMVVETPAAVRVETTASHKSSQQVHHSDTPLQQQILPPNLKRTRPKKASNTFDQKLSALEQNLQSKKTELDTSLEENKHLQQQLAVLEVTLSVTSSYVDKYRDPASFPPGTTTSTGPTHSAGGKGAGGGEDESSAHGNIQHLGLMSPMLERWTILNGGLQVFSKPWWTEVCSTSKEEFFLLYAHAVHIMSPLVHWVEAHGHNHASHGQLAPLIER